MSTDTIPEDIMKAAQKAFDAPIHRDGMSLVSLVSKDVQDEVMLTICRAILIERRHGIVLRLMRGED